MPRSVRQAALITAMALCLGASIPAKDLTIVVDNPIAPPAWALMERQLLDANSEAIEIFADKYIDERGYLLHTIRWGSLDGPDDAIETYYNWTLLHALGGRDKVLDIYKKGLEGHLMQYKELRTTKTKIAEHGAYHNEFITMSDFFHTGEGIRGFTMMGLADPLDEKFRIRTKRFAGLYMNEDPSAPNYDPKHKVIRSIWNGSKGPMMHKATVYDWVGDPVPGMFHILHSPQRRNKMLDLMSVYDKMLAHCTEYVDSVGDSWLNMGTAILGLNAYMLDHENKYRDWVLEYMDAWLDRTQQTGGMIPSTVGLDGVPGSNFNGQWWKSTYGWNFTIFDGEIEQIAHRNYFPVGPWPGFSTAYLLTGDKKYIDALRTQMDKFYEHARVENGRTLIPQMYGDPKGYKYKGDAEWYLWEPRLHHDRLTEIYLWSMDRRDLERIPKEGWIGFLEGRNPGHPETALQGAFDRLRDNLHQIRTDPTSPDTRLADWLLGFTPAQTDVLTQLMLGGYFSNGKLWTLHSRLRYFDPVERRSGPPKDVAALVDKLTADSVSVTLVNTSQAHTRTVMVQAGGYGEHQFDSVTVGGETTPIDHAYVTVRLEPGAGDRLEFKMQRYVNQPTLAQPWDRGWMVKN
ncbi:MAG: hypothetical protein OXB98_09220 [Bryobacterales bacterium]|nr:hypothetical protein [Bryobacterales bacterium]